MTSLLSVWVRAFGVVLASAGACFAFASPQMVDVLFRGKPLKFAKAIAPIRSQATVLVSFRETAKLIGATVSPTSDAKHVTLVYGDTVLTYEPGHHGYKLNGRRQNMRSSSEIRRKRLFVPVRLFTDLTSGRVRAVIR